MQAKAIKTAVLIIEFPQGLCTGEGAAFDTDGMIGSLNGVAERARVGA
jgi:hypothetical protein